MVLRPSRIPLTLHQVHPHRPLLGPADVLWLPFVFLTSFGFGQLFKWSQRRGCYAPAVVSTNYLVLAGTLLAYYLLTGGLDLGIPALILGLYTGTAFICSMLVMTWALEKAAVATVLTAFRLAILIPVLASIWLWGEKVDLTQGAGIALALASLVLMTRSQSGHGRLLGAAGAALTFLVFLLQGISHSCMRWIHYAGLDDQRQHVLLVTAAAAGILGRPIRPGQRAPTDAKRPDHGRRHRPVQPDGLDHPTHRPGPDQGHSLFPLAGLCRGYFRQFMRPLPLA